MKIKDQLGNELEFNQVPVRIISLVPSITEYLFDLGLKDQIVGLTKFCIHPDNLVSEKNKIGGTKNVNLSKVKDLQPDLIVANKEENVLSQIEALSKICPVYISDIDNVGQAYEMMRDLALIVDKKALASSIINNIEAKRIAISQSKNECKSVIYLIWKNPYMATGKHTFIDAMLTEIGLFNVVNDSRYPEIELNSVDADFIFLSTEPFPFSENDRKILQENFPKSKVVLVDGEMFSWYGSRMLKAYDYFKDLKNELHF